MNFEHPAIPFLGRLFLAYIFITSGLAKITAWDGNIAYMSTRHLPFIPELLAVAMLIELGGSVCLVTGYQARMAAVVMVLYMVVLTVLFHNYWSAPANLAGMQETHFRKNLAIIGGLLMVAAFGPGTWALDKRRHKASEPPPIT